MCWNIEFSLASAVLGWVACLYLWQRNYSVRDRWYAKYLSTFTLTQLVDIFFWWTHERSQQELGPGRGGLRACPELKEQFSMRLPAIDSGQQPQYLVSKLVIPTIVLVQFCNQLSYPGCREFFAERMLAVGVPGMPYWVLIAAHVLACAGMSFAFGCTDIQQCVFPEVHDSLRWGGHSAETWEVLVVVAVVCADFCVTMRELSVRLAHCGVFLGVVSTLWITEGSLAVGSKWCTYCLIFSAVYVSEPLWGPGPGEKNAEAPPGGAPCRSPRPPAPARRAPRTSSPAARARPAGAAGHQAPAKAAGGSWPGPSWPLAAALTLACGAAARASPAAALASQAVATLGQWVERAHDASWPWRAYSPIEEQLAVHGTFVVAEALFLASAVLALAHAVANGQKLLWSLTFIAGTANDYIFMLLPMVDSFWQAQAVLMLTPRMPLYIPCVYNAFMYWGNVAAQAVARGPGDGAPRCSRLAEASLAALLGCLLYAPYDLCGARFLWWTWHLDDAGVKLRWGGHDGGGGAPVGSTAWTLIFGFCFAWLLRLTHDRGCGTLGTVAVVAGLSTFSMMGLLTGLSAAAGDRMGMPGPLTLGAGAALLVLCCGREVAKVWCGSAAGTSPEQAAMQHTMASMPAPLTRLVRAFIVFYFGVLVATMALGQPETQVSTGVHQPFAMSASTCLAEDTDLVEYRRLRFACRDPPRHLPLASGSGGADTPWHARGWAHDAAELPPIHHPSEYLTFDCDRDPAVLAALERAGVQAIPPEAATLSAEGLASWYTVCGVASSNVRGLSWCVVLGLLGVVLFDGSLSMSQRRSDALGQQGGTLSTAGADEPLDAAPASEKEYWSARSGDGDDDKFRSASLSEASQDRWVEKTNQKRLSAFGRALKHGLDPVVEPLLALPGGWFFASIALGALMLGLQFAAGAAFQRALGPDILGPGAGTVGGGGRAAAPGEGLLLQPLYESAKALLAIAVAGRLGPLGIVHPMVPSLIAVGGYFSLSLAFTLVDVLFTGCGVVQASQAQAESGKVARTSLERFGGKSLGLWRVVKSHVLFQLVLVPVYCMLLWRPQEMHMYPTPWFSADSAAGSSGAVPALPASAPTLPEFILTYLFSLLSMDAGYGWWHFLAHRYKQIYKNVHAWHHEYHAPFALVSQHAHPVELGVTGALAVCGPIACGAHPFVLWVALLSSVVMSVDAHCGYDLPWFLNARKLTFGIVGGMRHHDDHHRKPWGNFAPFFTYLDVLACTNHEDVGPISDMHA